MRLKTITACFAAAATLMACSSGSSKVQQAVVEDVSGGVNPYLWRASLDALQDLPVTSADPLGGIIIYDWQSFEDAPGERIEATVYILDSRLRADGVNVSVFRQTNEAGTWTDASIDTDTEEQLESAILQRARALKASEAG